MFGTGNQSQKAGSVESIHIRECCLGGECSVIALGAFKWQIFKETDTRLRKYDSHRLLIRILDYSELAGLTTDLCLFDCGGEADGGDLASGSDLDAESNQDVAPGLAIQ